MFGLNLQNVSLTAVSNDSMGIKVRNSRQWLVSLLPIIILTNHGLAVDGKQLLTGKIFISSVCSLFIDFKLYNVN